MIKIANNIKFMLCKQAKKSPSKEKDPPVFSDEQSNYEDENPQVPPLTWGEIAFLTGGGLAGAAAGGYGMHTAFGNPQLTARATGLGAAAGLIGGSLLSQRFGLGPDKARSPRQPFSPRDINPTLIASLL